MTDVWVRRDPGSESQNISGLDSRSREWLQTVGGRATTGKPAWVVPRSTSTTAPTRSMMFRVTGCRRIRVIRSESLPPDPSHSIRVTNAASESLDLSHCHRIRVTRSESLRTYPNHSSGTRCLIRSRPGARATLPRAGSRTRQGDVPAGMLRQTPPIQPTSQFAA